MNTSTNTPTTDSLEMLDILKTAVLQTLEKKKLLGQYAVIWRDNEPLVIGDDAPREKGHPKKP